MQMFVWPCTRRLAHPGVTSAIGEGVSPFEPGQGGLPERRTQCLAEIGGGCSRWGTVRIGRTDRIGAAQAS